MPLPKYLIDRYKDWKNNLNPNNLKLHKELEKNQQKPKAMFISCCDSRVNPSKIFKENIGDFFIYRNIANLVPDVESKNPDPGTLSAIEYGIKSLHISDLIILGHSSCGGIKHAYEYFADKIPKQKSFLNEWILNIKPAFEELDKNHSEDLHIKFLEKLSIKKSILNIYKIPEIKNLILNSKLKIHGLWYEIGTGNLFEYNIENDDFEKLDY